MFLPVRLLPGALLLLAALTLRAAPPASGLQAWWPMDESVGTTAVDASGNGRNATTSNVTWQPAGGKVGGAASFDGNFSVAAFSVPAWTTITFAAWINPTGNGDSNYPRWIDIMNFRFGVVRGSPGGEPNNGFFVGAERADGTTNFRSAANAVPTSGWIHVAVVYDSTVASNAPLVYLNGSQVSVTPLGAQPTGTMNAAAATGYLGGRAALDRSFAGLLDEVVIYNRALTPTEISQLAGGTGVVAGGDFETARAVALPPRDFDGDGIPDIGERALGTNRTASDAGNATVTPATGPGTLDVTYLRAADASRWQARVEASADLQGWSSANVTQEHQVGPAPDGRTEVTARVAGAGSRQFARIVASDAQVLPELTFNATRDLWARILLRWKLSLNTAGTAGTAASAHGGADFEWVTRMLWPLAGWFSQPGRPSSLSWNGSAVDVGQILTQALVNGTDPAHPNRWPYAANQGSQIVVEAPQVAWSSWILHRAKQEGAAGGALWDGLTSAHRSNLQAFLAGMGNGTYANNWNLFIVVNHEARKRLNLAGVTEFNGYSQSVIDGRLKLMQDMNRGGGWYGDGTTEESYDDYNPWVILSHHLVHFIMGNADSQAQTVIPNTGGRGRAEILADVSNWLKYQVRTFDGWGGNPEYGRSSTYKFARLTTFALAYYIDRTYNTPDRWNLGFKVLPEEITPGMLRRLVRLHINHYLANGAIDPVTAEIKLGQTPESGSEVQETYIGPGSNFWSMYLLGALFLLPDADPLWSVAENPLPSEEFAYESWFQTPGVMIRNLPAQGHLEMINARTWKDESQAWQQQSYGNKYSKFTYSSLFGYCTRSGSRLDQNIMIGSNWRVRPLHGSLFLRFDRTPDEPGVIRTVHEQPGSGGNARIRTLIFVKDGAQLRVHRITGANGFSIREGGYALGHGAAETPPAEVTGPDWVYLESSVGAAFAARILGYTAVGTVSGTGNHSRSAKWRIPHAEIPSNGAASVDTAILVQGSAARFDPAAVRALVQSVGISGSTVQVTWSDGTFAAADFAP
jgi:hypothetical protein